MKHFAISIEPKSMKLIYFISSRDQYFKHFDICQFLIVWVDFHLYSKYCVNLDIIGYVFFIDHLQSPHQIFKPKNNIPKNPVISYTGVLISVR